VKILVTGTTGQVGWELVRTLTPLGEVVRCDRSIADLSRPDALRALILDVRPAVVVNAAAYTAVDKAEEEEDLATVINGEAPGVLAAATRDVGGLFVHYSTDYVFDGVVGHYDESGPPNPLNAYGRSKLAGERAVADAGGSWLTFRAAWVYAARAENFFLTMLRLATRHEKLNVVADQFGAPTSARLIASLTAHAVARALAEMRADTFESGVFHMTSDGDTSRHGFVEAIVCDSRSALPDGFIKTREVLPVSSDAFPTPAVRPKNSVLSNRRFDDRFGLHRPHWREDLRDTIAELSDAAKLYRAGLLPLPG
jgi:dTDP-4-dehydrorhamnose reductase